MKSFLTILILTFGLVFVSCKSNPPEPPTRNPDREATNVGNSTKTPNYKFADGFTYHEWKGESVITWDKVPFSFNELKTWYKPGKYWGKGYFNNTWYVVKKLVTSKYFDIYVDITDGTSIFKAATNMTDVAYDKLIRELEKDYNRMKSIYGEHSDVDGNGKIEIIFHNVQLPELGNNWAGYFNAENIWKRYLYTGEADILYIRGGKYMNAKAQKDKKFDTTCADTIFHELQHDMRAKSGAAWKPERWIDEALALSTYIVRHNGTNSGRTPNLAYTNTIVNGKYFFDWENITDSENYETAANFMYWLYIHGGGDQIIRDIVNSNPNKVIDMDSIGTAARKNIPFFKNQNYMTVVKTWYVANFKNESNSIYGYKNRNQNIKVGMANNRSGKVTLRPYCAVYTTPDMYSANSSTEGLYLEKIKNSRGEEWLLLLNIYTSIKYGHSVEVKINPNVNITFSPLFIDEKYMWTDGVFYEDEE